MRTVEEIMRPVEQVERDVLDRAIFYANEANHFGEAACRTNDDRSRRAYWNQRDYDIVRMCALLEVLPNWTYAYKWTDEGPRPVEVIPVNPNKGLL